MSGSDAAAVHELLRDSFTRLIEHVEELTDGLTDEVAFFRPTASANSISWLIWHSARQQDLQLAHIAGTEAGLDPGRLGRPLRPRPAA